LVDHGSLDDLIEQKKNLPEELVLEAGIQVAKGLRAAYGKGLIHRDVKPANILFSDEHTAKIGDFGLAGVAAETGEAKGEIWGTPYYVAPERLYNRPEDFRSDMYSLGATLFHAISGRAPIEAETNSATALRDLKNRPLDLRTIAPEVSEETANVFQRMIAPEPLKRYGSYDELVAALEAAYASLTGKEYLLAERKSKMPWIIGVAVLMVALIGLGTWAYRLRQRNQAERQRSQSELKTAAERAERTAALARFEGRVADARHELSYNPPHFNKAKEAFGRIADDAKGRQPVYDWALLQEGLSAMIGGRASEANDVFKKVEAAGSTGFAKEETDLANFFLTTAKTLVAPEAVLGNTTRSPNNYEAFALFPFALKNIAQSDTANAIPLLEQFINAKPTGNHAWIAQYTPLARRYLDDCKTYADWKKEGEEAKDPAAMARHVANTHDIIQKKKLESHTALFADVRTAEQNFSRQNVDQQKADNASRERERQQQADQMAQKRPQWESDWQRRLIDDLNRLHFAGEVVTLTGAKYSGILGATPQNLRMKLPYGEAQVPWAQIPPRTLLAISAFFIKANQPDTADREWLCAVYAADHNLPEDAKRLADAAAKGKPEYAQALPALNLSDKKPPAARTPGGR
jgi:hypothetical protein